MGWEETVKKAEKLVEEAMAGNDASHDASHVWRVRDLALSLAREQGLSSSPHSMQIVSLSLSLSLSPVLNLNTQMIDANTKIRFVCSFN